MRFLKLLPVVAMLMFAFSSCRMCDKGDCSVVACTDDFRAVSITLTDAQGTPVTLTDYYTIRESTQENIRDNGANTEDGRYNVLTDSYQPSLVNQQDRFTFVGIINGNEVVRETFTISADCCHIDYITGNREVTVN